MIHSCQHEDDRKRAAEKGQGGSQRTVVMPTPFLHRGLIGRRLSGQKYTQSMDFSTHRETETIHSSNSNRGKGDDLLGLWDVINTSRGMFKNVFAIQDSSPVKWACLDRRLWIPRLSQGYSILSFTVPGSFPGMHSFVDLRKVKELLLCSGPVWTSFILKGMYVCSYNNWVIRKIKYLEVKERHSLVPGHCIFIPFSVVQRPELYRYKKNREKIYFDMYFKPRNSLLLADLRVFHKSYLGIYILLTIFFNLS